MTRIRWPGLIVPLAFALAGCVTPEKKPLVDPSRIAFPLAEAGKLEIEGDIAGQPRARDGIVYLATREGWLTAVVVPAQAVLWRFKADHPISSSPELAGEHILLHDQGGILYVLGRDGRPVLKKQIDDDVTTSVWEQGGRAYLGTAGGKIVVLDISGGEAQVWESRSAAALTAGPAFAGDLVIFGSKDGDIVALGPEGKRAWTFAARGAVDTCPGVADGRLFFGTKERFFYCLDAATGKKIWSRRLQGAPLHAPLIQGRQIIVAASNSVIYILSRRGGSILSWEAVPSRIVYEPALAGPLILVSSAAGVLSAIDLRTGRRIGQHIASDPSVAGALWVPPFMTSFEEDAEHGWIKLVLYRSDAGASPGRR